jgi:hypothetical protein
MQLAATTINALLAQTPAAASSGPSASTIFYITLLFIFLTAIVSTFVTRWSKDKCLALLKRSHVTLLRNRGTKATWGVLKVFSAGVEIIFDSPYTDLRGHRRTTQLFYQNELDGNVLCLCRVHDELPQREQDRRAAQVRAHFNPGPLKRTWRGVRNMINTLRDAVNTAIGAAVKQYAQMNPGSAVLSTQTGAVTQIGQTLVGRFGNAYEPLLEQYIGKPVIMDLADPLDPNNATVQFSGFLADYTQNWVALLNREHKVTEEFHVDLPDVEGGESLPPLPGIPLLGAVLPALPPPMASVSGLELRIDGARFKLFNSRHYPMVVRRLERTGFEALRFGTVIPPRCWLELPVRDARGSVLYVSAVDNVDIVAPRKWATIRHAGTCIPTAGLIDDLHLDQLPLVKKRIADVLQEDVTELLRR